MLSKEELEALDKRLAANADRLIAKRQRVLYNFKETKAGRKPAFFFNCIQPEISALMYHDDDSWPLWVDDVVSGVARLDWYRSGSRSVPLSRRDILKCFANLDRIDASTISHLLGIGERQAQRYLKACELCHQRLIDNYCNDEVRCMHYPRTFIYPKE